MSMDSWHGSWWRLLAAACLTLASCRQHTVPERLPARPIGTPLALKTPLGLPPVRVPAENPPTTETVALGEKLFMSPLLSADHTIACSSCHDPRRNFVDGERFSAGVGGKRGNRNAPSARNAAYYATQFWDGRAASLEDQAVGPMTNPLEMAHAVEGVERDLSKDAEWRDEFEKAFGPATRGSSPVSIGRITAALASYERTLVRGNSAFDRYFFGGDTRALSDSAAHGLAVFRDPAKGNCVACHIIESKYALLTDNKFHNLGTGMNAEGELTDLGRYNVTHREGDQSAFRTPSLRDVATTAPYMHDGSLKTLKEVVDFYVGGGNANPHRDQLIKPLTHLTRQERADLVAFLESLTGEDEP